jgi:hypothetical protein
LFTIIIYLLTKIASGNIINNSYGFLGIEGEWILGLLMLELACGIILSHTIWILYERINKPKQFYKMDKK